MRAAGAWIALFMVMAAGYPTKLLAEELSVSALPSLARFNVRASPLGLLFGVFGGSVDIGASERFAIGPSFATLQTAKNVVEIDVYQFGLTGSYFLHSDRFRSGPVIRASIDYVLISFNNRAGGVGEIGTLNNWIAASTIGYHWQHAAGPNFCLGLGLALYNSSPSASFNTGSGTRSKITFISADGFQPSLEASLGWAI